MLLLELTLKLTVVAGQIVVDVEAEIDTAGVEAVLVSVTVLLLTAEVVERHGVALDTIVTYI
jgi:hypothetical protein